MNNLYKYPRSYAFVKDNYFIYLGYGATNTCQNLLSIGTVKSIVPTGIRWKRLCFVGTLEYRRFQLENKESSRILLTI